MLRIEMTDWEERTYTAVYDSFSIDSEKDLYRLHIGDYHGDAGDSLKSHWENHDGMPFSTKDRDNDGRYYDSCAEHFHGAWWFNNCFDSHLNGKYYHKGFHKNYFQRDGIQWNTIHMYSSLKSVHMMLKPASAPPTTAPPPKAESSKRSGEGRKRERSGKGRNRGGRRDRKKQNWAGQQNDSVSGPTLAKRHYAEDAKHLGKVLKTSRCVGCTPHSAPAASYVFYVESMVNCLQS
ncbi:hypothetical protein BaRGS_00009631 [Batillaria attramentaria]|uniref:Fibrinogen C-terminal domain-containing protein n=1 Tax=Batillaria attramentaria TaxID=370345 RepID=A0ABD0LHT0_9CAEN